MVKPATQSQRGQSIALVQWLRYITGYCVGIFLVMALFLAIIIATPSWMFSPPWGAIPYIVACLASPSLNSLLMGFSEQHSLKKAVILYSQIIPLILLTWFFLSASDSGSSIEGETVGGGLEGWLILGMIIVSLVGSYWGMSNPITSWFKNRDKTKYLQE